jgi:hypothetical protein
MAADSVIQKISQSLQPIDMFRSSKETLFYRLA